jgi:hypothetical protein
VKLGFLCAALLALNAGAASRPPETQAERDTVQGVRVAIQHKDCKLAVSRLNDGLANAYPDVFLMAGRMFEDGICVKPSWERAERLYQRADEVGHHGGLLRLVAGLAHQNRDPAAALWWAHKAGGLNLPQACRVPHLALEPEVFVSTLKLWPAQRLQGCVYTAGVVALVAGDLDYPQTAFQFSVAGKVAMVFKPAEGKLGWRTVDIEMLPMYGLVSGDQLLDRDSRAVKASLERHLRELGERALRRYEKPAGIDPEWDVSMDFVFSITY